MTRPSFALLIAASAALLFAPRAEARPLDPETCNRLIEEQAQLEQAGVHDTLVKGPAWARTNLSGKQLEIVKQYIEIEEAVSFRCMRPRPLPPESVHALPPAPEPGAPVPKARPKVRAAAAAPAGAGITSGGPVGATPVPASPKPKPRAAPAKPPARPSNDAFTPSAPHTGIEN